MSEESAKKFVDAVKTDKELADKLDGAESKEERMRIVQDAGYSFTEAELASVKGELSPEELDITSGGWTPCFDCDDCDRPPPCC